VLLAFSLAAAALTAPQAPTGAPGLVTRLVAEFSEREAALARMLATGDKAAALSLVEQDFELVTAANLNQSTPFDAFVDEQAQHPRRILTIRDLSVREMGAVALVSFSWDEKAPSSQNHVTWMVLDAWRSGPDGWKLKTRFIGMRGNSAITPPGYRTQDSEIEKKY